MCMCACIYLSVHYVVPGAPGSQKIALDLLKLELQVVVSCYVAAGN